MFIMKKQVVNGKGMSLSEIGTSKVLRTVSTSKNNVPFTTVLVSVAIMVATPIKLLASKFSKKEKKPDERVWY